MNLTIIILISCAALLMLATGALLGTVESSNKETRRRVTILLFVGLGLLVGAMAAYTVLYRDLDTRARSHEDLLRQFTVNMGAMNEDLLMTALRDRAGDEAIAREVVEATLTPGAFYRNVELVAHLDSLRTEDGWKEADRRNWLTVHAIHSFDIVNPTDYTINYPVAIDFFDLAQLPQEREARAR